MNYKIEITKETNKAWAWHVKQAQSIVAGGYCRTKRDAQSDAELWVQSHSTER